MPEFVQARECVDLPLPRRIAWASLCVERALRCYSAHFQEKYLAHEVFALAWSYATSGQDDVDARRDLIKRVCALENVAEREGYVRWCVLILYEILAEIDRPDGLTASDAVQMAGSIFAIGVWFQYSTDPRHIRVPLEDFGALQARFATFSRQVFQAVASGKDLTTIRERVEAIPLDSTYTVQPRPKTAFRTDYDFPPRERPATLVANSPAKPPRRLPARITRKWLAGISADWQLNPPAPPEQIEAATSKLGLRFPRDYVAFLRASNGMKCFDLDHPPADPADVYIWLFDLGRLVIANRLRDVRQRAPGCLVIGRYDDEGPIFLHLAKGDARRAPVYQQQDEDFGIHPDTGTHRLYGRKAESLTAWLAAGCPLPEAMDDDQE